MARYSQRCIPIRPYHVYKTPLVDPGWAIWDRRHARHLSYPEGTWLHSTHAAAIAALDAYLRERIVMELGK